MADILIVRLEQYPPNEPTGWAVGFSVICNNGRSFYIDTVVPFDKASTDEDAVNVALQDLKDTIQQRIKELEKKTSLIGTKLVL